VTAEALRTHAVSLVLAFGGGLGSYRNEHNDWRLGVLLERTELSREDKPEPPPGVAAEESSLKKVAKEPAVCIHWSTPRRVDGLKVEQANAAAVDEYPLETNNRPQARAAHSATFVPARFLEGFPEGAVVVAGGHTNDVSEELSTVDVLNLATWVWQRDVVPVDQPDASLPRHGHSASVVEVNGNGFLMVVGGGTGNILAPMQRCRESRNVHVLDLRRWRWLGNGITLVAAGGDSPGGGIGGRHHTGCVTASRDGRIILFGGGHEPSNEVLVLNAVECVKLAQQSEPGRVASVVVPENERPPPRPRKMHGAACLLPWLPILVVFGGWERGPHFEDMSLCALGNQTKGGVKGSEVLGEEEEDEQEVEEESDDEPGDGDGGDDEDEIITVRLNGPQGMRLMQMPRRYLQELIASGALQGEGGDDSDDES
jgi:hypothetical protein